MGFSRIMIVEDNTTVAKDLCTCLQRFDYDVVSTVASGEESIERAAADRPDIVLMDIRLRDEMDGIEAAERIRSRFGIPIVFLSAHTDHALLERAGQVGSFGYLVKPYNDRELYANIEMTLHKAKADKETQRLHAEIRQHEEKLHDLAIELLSIAEKGRKNIANELHENIVQIMVTSLDHMKLLRESEDAPDRISAIDKTIDLTNQAIEHARTLTYQLFPPNLRELGLDAALAWYLEQWQKDHPMVCSFVGGLKPNTVNEDIKAFLFRSTQELLTNIVKHAQAKRVKLATWKTEDSICISIEDDGVGFNPDETPTEINASGGFGLFSIRERLHDLGGKLDIDSQIGRGTKVMITVPDSRTITAGPEENAVPAKQTSH